MPSRQRASILGFMVALSALAPARAAFATGLTCSLNVSCGPGRFEVRAQTNWQTGPYQWPVTFWWEWGDGYADEREFNQSSGYTILTHDYGFGQINYLITLDGEDRLGNTCHRSYFIDCGGPFFSSEEPPQPGTVARDDQMCRPASLALP